MKTYPMLAFVLRFRRIVVAGCTALPAAAGAWAAHRTELPELAVAGVVAAVFAALVSSSCLELVELVSDTLIPR